MATNKIIFFFLVHEIKLMGNFRILFRKPGAPAEILQGVEKFFFNYTQVENLLIFHG